MDGTVLPVSPPPFQTECLADYTDDVTFTGGQFVRDYTLNFSSALPGQTLTVNWIMSGGWERNHQRRISRFEVALVWKRFRSD